MNALFRVASLFLVALVVTGTVRDARSTTGDQTEVTPPQFKENISLPTGLVPSADRNIAPDFSWFDKQGKPVSLKDYRGKVLFVNFWGTWCRPCRQELPDIISLAREYEGEVVFLGVAMERGGGDVFQNLLNFTKEQKMTYQIIVGSEELAGAFGGLAGVPTTFVIDKQGKIIGSLVGMRTKAAFEELIKKGL